MSKEQCIKWYGVVDGTRIFEHWQMVQKRIAENPTVIEIPPVKADPRDDLLRQVLEVLELARNAVRGGRRDIPECTNQIGRAKQIIHASLNPVGRENSGQDWTCPDCCKKPCECVILATSPATSEQPVDDFDYGRMLIDIVYEKMDGPAKLNLNDAIYEGIRKLQDKGVYLARTTALPAADLVERVHTAVDAALRQHKMSHQLCQDGETPLPLVDALTPEGMATIKLGEMELEALIEAAVEAALSALPSAPLGGVVERAFQNRVDDWMQACFGIEIAADKTERNHRFLEEALELVQSCGATASECHQLVDYVFGRPTGEPHQELGGVMVTLAALASANDMSIISCGEIELRRIWTKVEQIRAKQAAKPKHSPLPQALSTSPDEQEVVRIVADKLTSMDADDAVQGGIAREIVTALMARYNLTERGVV